MTKHRVEQRKRLVPHTIDGRVRMVNDTYDVRVPVPPRDWDHIVLRAATVTTGAVVGASVVWSTASIAGLLDVSVATPVAFAAAAVFDLVWITCMALEWLARYDRDRARTPRLAGHAALAVAMLAVAAHGWATGNVVTGLVGGVVSGMAKGLWSVLIAHTARRLDDRTRQWVDQEMAEASARLGLAAVRRQLARATAVAALVNAEANTANNPDDDPNTPVRQGVRETANTPVEPAAQDTVRAEHPNTDEHANSSSESVVRLVPNSGETIADTVQRLVRNGVCDREQVLAAVRDVHGTKTSRDTVRITLDRALKRLSA